MKEKLEYNESLKIVMQFYEESLNFWRREKAAVLAGNPQPGIEEQDIEIVRRSEPEYLALVGTRGLKHDPTVPMGQPLDRSAVYFFYKQSCAELKSENLLPDQRIIDHFDTLFLYGHDYINRNAGDSNDKDTDVLSFMDSFKLLDRYQTQRERHWTKERERLLKRPSQEQETVVDFHLVEMTHPYYLALMDCRLLSSDPKLNKLNLIDSEAKICFYAAKMREFKSLLPSKDIQGCLEERYQRYEDLQLYKAKSLICTGKRTDMRLAYECILGFDDSIYLLQEIKSNRIV